MKRLLLYFLFLSLFSTAAYAQSSYSVKGSVIDTTTNAKLINTSVSVIRAKDSILVKFTRTAQNGSFTLSNLPKGKMFILVTYPGYADYVESFTLDSANTTMDFKNVKLILKANLLKDVIIKGKIAAIKIKGDTTEYNAAAYQIQPNSKVEDLLKQIQGIQVDKDGKITAQGATVSKVLVDGEEFFGDDPTLVTKNIRADMVDKVQLYDKKSDQAAFTGVDDGQKTKTINIKLKEDKKNGYFGKLDAAVGTDDYYQGQGMFNAFKGKTRFSAYGTIANTGKTGLGWEDNSKYGSNNNFEIIDGGFYFSGSSDALDSFDGRYNGQGIPVARNSGAHYETKWNEDKESINGNYKIGSLNVKGSRNTLSQNNLPTGIINTTSDQNFDNYMFRQKLDATYNIKLDTSSNLKVSVDGTLKNNETKSDYATQSLRGDSLLNESERHLSNNGNDKLFNAKLLYTRKLKKIGRTVSVNLSQSMTNSETKGFINSNSRFYNTVTGALDSSQLVDQYKTSLIKTSVFNANATFTEPLSKKLNLVFNYGFALNNSTSNRKSFNQAANGEYTDLDRNFSNDYELNQISNQLGATLNYKSQKTTVNVGTKATNVDFDQKDLYNQTTFSRNFVNWAPQANYSYKFSQQKSINLWYSGYTTQPTIEQIQPVLNNNDNINIIVGNPNLRPSFNNNVSVYYNSYKMLSSQSIYANASYSRNYNQIVNNTTTEASGKSIFQSINLTDKQTTSASLYFDYGQKIKPLDINGGFNLRVSTNQSYNYINSVLNENKGATYTGRLSLSKYKEKKYDISINGGPSYTTNQSSLQSVNDNGWGATGYADFTVYLPLKFEIGSDANYQFRAKTASFNEDFSLLLWNARVSKKFLKSDALKFSLAVNDLLNKNVGFNRSASGNMITQSSYTTIKRYFTASISWDFNKMGGSAPKK